MDYEALGIKRSALVRKNPAAVGLSKYKSQIEKYAEEYSQFLKHSRTAHETVRNVKAMALDAGYKLEMGPDPFFVEYLEGSAFALVHPGKARKKRGEFDLDKWIRKIVAHTDSPSLRLRVNPTEMNKEEEINAFTGGVSLSVSSIGGARPRDWFGKVKVVGSICENGIFRDIEFPGTIMDASIHVDDKWRWLWLENMKVSTGIQSVGEFYKMLGIKNERDFANSKLYVVPSNTNVLRIGNGKITDLLSGYGHDDRACVFASVKAMLESNPEVPCFVFGLDQEESGFQGPAAGYDGFCRDVLSSTFKEVLGISENLEDIFGKKLIKNSENTPSIPAISADVSLAATNAEFNVQNDEDGQCLIHPDSVAKFGHGIAVTASEGNYEGNVINPLHMNYILNLIKEMLRTPTKKQATRFQIVGHPGVSDDIPSGGTLADLFTRKGVPMLDVGIPTSSLHRPDAENITLVDSWLTKQFYRAYLTRMPRFFIRSLKERSR